MSPLEKLKLQFIHGNCTVIRLLHPTTMFIPIPPLPGDYYTKWHKEVTKNHWVITLCVTLCLLCVTLCNSIKKRFFVNPQTRTQKTNNKLFTFTKHQTSNIKHQTPQTQHQTSSNTKHQTPNIKQTLNLEPWTRNKWFILYLLNPKIAN